MQIRTQDGIWERQAGLSEVAKTMVRQSDPTDKTGRILNCLICNTMGIERPGVCMTLFECKKKGEEAFASMAVCRAHRAQWKLIDDPRVFDGQRKVNR